MRIRKSASRLLGSAAAPAPDAAPPSELPPPPPRLAPCSAPEYGGGGGVASPATASGQHCQLNRSPWDLIAELSLSDPQVEDDLVDKYFVPVSCRASWLFTASMPAAAAKKKEKPAVAAAGWQPRREVAKKAPKRVSASEEKDGEVKEAEVKKKEGEEGGTQVWKCRKNNGKSWHCNRTVNHPNSLCDYHFVQKRRSYLRPDFEFTSAAASKPSKKPRKKKSGGDLAATEGFYYYTEFGHFHTKRHCRNSGMNEPVPAKQEEEEQPRKDASSTDQAQPDDTNQAAAHHDVSSCDVDIARIAGGDKESSDDCTIGTSGGSMNGNGVPRGDSKRKSQWKLWRKPVKARSLKSLM